MKNGKLVFLAAIAMVFALAFTLAACAGASQPGATEEAGSAEPEAPAETSGESATPPEQEGETETAQQQEEDAMTTMLYQGHGSYRFTLDDGIVVYVDPFAGEGYDKPADLIVVTHEHFDHNQVDKMPHADGCEIVRAADLHPTPDSYLTLESHGVRMMGVQAYNKNHPVDECVGVVLKFDGISFYASGDTSTTEDMTSGKLAALNLDYAAFPGDGFYNMDVAEASACAALVGARHSIPVHLVPVDNPDDPSQLFSREQAEAFQAEGRIIVEPGEEITL